VSTLFPQYAENSDEGYSNITVQVRTLDWLREKYGAPKYVKIDTEGSDAEVIRGMSFQPAMLSFEFLPEDLSVARKCVEQLPDRRFNYVLEQQARYALEDWVTAEQISRVLEDVPKTVFYGDVFAR
ncbi:MAG TPA: FkbM family methyltransferase, partial [Acidobacteriaceae bacterium]|nr:FkbM family methyltransferase [Acidobacteriaceae bacterium]